MGDGIGLVVFRVVFGLLLIVVGIMSARKLHKDKKEEAKRGLWPHLNKYFPSYLFIIIGIYILIKGF